jgi:apolipoprotein N-acyltransferase
MDSRLDAARGARAPFGIVAIALTAIGWWFANSLQPSWWAAWLAPLPLLAYALRTRACWAALATFVAFAIGGSSLWHYLHAVVRLPFGVCVAAIVMPAALMLLAVLPFRALLLRGHALAATFFLPAAATGLAWLSATLSPHGTFGNIAYSQMDALPIVQAAAVAGVWGIGFLIWLLPSALAVATSDAVTSRQRTLVTAAAGGVLVVAVLEASGACTTTR